MSSFLLLVLLGCVSDPDRPGPDSGQADSDGGDWDGGGSDGGGSDGGGSDGGGSDGGGSDGGAEGADLQVDVLVIGSGPAGLSAAWEADQAGATVLLVERQDSLGGAGAWAGHFLAAGTRWQSSAGISDSPEQLLAEWEAMTQGDPDDPWVQQFVEQSSATLEWLVDLGASVDGVVDDHTCGSVARIHQLSPSTVLGDEGTLVEQLAPLAWTGVEATALRVDPDDARRVAGAWVQDLETGEVLELAATSTVVATGGFARDVDRVQADIPSLADLTWVFEAHFGSDGGGHVLLDEQGVAWQNPGGMGLYVHSAADPREGYEGEALLLPAPDRAMVVDADGQRVGNEEETLGFLMQEHLLAAPGQRLWLVKPEGLWQEGGAWSFNRMLTDPSEEDYDLSPDDLLDLGVGVAGDNATELAGLLGIDPDGLVATMQRYDSMCHDGEDLDFGKRIDAMLPFDGQRLYAVELRPGAAKAFGGATMDLQGRVLDTDGAVIPGLYAAGEVAGMLGTPAVGQGFSGSITSVYLTGRIAGQTAAAEAMK